MSVVPEGVTGTVKERLHHGLGAQGLFFETKDWDHKARHAAMEAIYLQFGISLTNNLYRTVI